jgi:DNA invertase Pin-like site-specific DNA recombinase
VVNGEQKITSSHRERLAVVYLRQSSMAQVREHTESTTRQYGLAGEATRLGWAPGDVQIIDTDLGISGRFGVAREGFRDLVSLVCRGEAGAIFGIEISRLARSNADVGRLIEFARITDTLLIDSDGVYDPADVNDRMLLGLKGTMGEVELHVMAGRLQAAKRAAAARGELRTPLPVGYVHDDAGGVVIDPDAEVQAAIADVFGLRRGGSVRRPPVPAARLRRRVGRPAALGPSHPRPCRGRAEEPGLRGRVCPWPLRLPAERR